MLRRLSLVSLACLVPLGALAQRFPGLPKNSNPCQLEIRVAYEDDHPAERMLQVELLAGNGGIMGQSFTDDRGMVTFQVTGGGNFRVRITGTDIAETTSSFFSIDDRELSHIEYVNVHRVESQSNAPTGPGGTVSVADLNVPAAAAKEFRKGNEALDKNDLVEARKRFDKAIQIYPSYASAFFGIGVVEFKSGDRQKAREAFEKTVALNDHFVPAYFNLARMAAADSDYKRAAELLSKASTADPVNPEGLLLTAQVDLLLHDSDGAIQCAKRLHSMPHQAYAVVHYIAARAYLSKHMPNEAAAEYKQFLEEAPQDPKAPKVRDELAALTKFQSEKALASRDAQKPDAQKPPDADDAPEPPDSPDPPDQQSPKAPQPEQQATH
ncbi:MAG TPA: tetratricopeptide repeat protein [Terriglobales bacterium]|jgi:tetratricopeptide (TPR) repeat protein|nr:tetratricopeptide repeat protein [Terriglobales bacterium]